ncbi:hypothetical protein SNEBB_009895 [Seison nebaliae]|nr:hypothetical protein SNEBB_009895 [Seison nebaliae]
MGDSIGFGRKAGRFNAFEIHPQYRRLNAFTAFSKKSGHPGPAYYNVDDSGPFSESKRNKVKSAPGWGRQLYVEHMAKIPPVMMKLRKEIARTKETSLGPGKYEVGDSYMSKFGKPVSRRGMLDMRAPRFPNQYLNDVPGPGTYPHDRTKSQCSGNRTYFETVEAIRGLGRMSDTVGPGTYEIPSEIDKMLNKRSGTKGPYQVFTIDRQEPINTGHYAKQPIDLGPGEYNYKTFTQDLDKRRVGRFGPSREIDHLSLFYDWQKGHPPVGTYSLNFEEKKLENKKKPPFKSTAKRDYNWANDAIVGVGRYSVKDLSRKYPITSSFLSKVPRDGCKVRNNKIATRVKNQSPNLPKEKGQDKLMNISLTANYIDRSQILLPSKHLVQSSGFYVH